MLSLLRGNDAASTPLRVAADLVYTSATSCRAAGDLPSTSDALAAQLLPEAAAFRGNLQLSRAASGDGCALYLTLKGAVSTAAGFSDAFDVARSVHRELAALLSAKGLESVALARVAVALDGDKLLAMSLQPFDAASATESVLTVQQGACIELLTALKSEDDAEMLLPRQVETSALDVTMEEGAGEGDSCVVALEVSALTPSLREDAEAFQLLKAVDEKMDAFFAGQESATLASVNVRLQVAAQGSGASTPTQTLAVTTESGSATDNLTLNAPTYEEALGIFAFVAVLLAMMMGVVVQKKRNDQRSRERYERASRAAQIRRVSIRMSQYDQEENHVDELEEGEEDSLL